LAPRNRNRQGSKFLPSRLIKNRPQAFLEPFSKLTRFVCEKIAQTSAQPFLQKLLCKRHCTKNIPKMWVTYVFNFKITARKQAITH
jgi:hypothetical protein